MQITFKHLKFQNFGSYRNEQTYNFENGIDIISATNGLGKSTIWNALFYVLFGKTYKKLKLNSLINRKTKKKLLTEVEFQIASNVYKITRGIKPNIFNIHKNGELIPEMASVKDYQKHLEENILKISDSVFRQLISITANQTNSKTFMELTTREKESLFQVITDTSIFSSIESILKTKISESKSSIKQIQYKKNILENNIKSTRINFETIEKKNKDFETNHKDNIKRVKNDIDRAEENITKLRDILIKLKDIKLDFDNRQENINKLKTEIQEISKTLNSLDSKISYIESAKKSAISCTQCNTINYLVQVDVNELDNLVESKKTNENKRDTKNDELIKLQIESDKLKEKLLQGKRVHSSLEEQKSNLDYSKTKLKELDNIETIDIDYSTLDNLKVELNEVNTNLKESQDYLYKHTELNNIISANNLKGEVLKTQIPLLNRNINKFLELFSLLDYNFVIDENFKERIIQQNDESEFHSLSNGEIARLTFSIMFAFLGLVEERNGVKTNLLILDEVLDSSLDYSGKTELLDIIKSEFSSNKNVVIISHSDEIKQRVDVFDRIITIKDDNGSEILFG